MCMNFVTLCDAQSQLFRVRGMQGQLLIICYWPRAWQEEASIRVRVAHLSVFISFRIRFRNLEIVHAQAYTFVGVMFFFLWWPQILSGTRRTRTEPRSG